MLLDVLFESQIYLEITVEVLDKAEEFGKFISIIEVFIKFVIIIKYRYENSHYIRKNRDSKQKDKRTKQSFKITFSMKISEPNSWQGRKCKVYNFDRINYVIRILTLGVLFIWEW